jgi:hypothetical protein
VLIGFALACAIRLSLLLWIVHQAAPRAARRRAGAGA